AVEALPSLPLDGRKAARATGTAGAVAGGLPAEPDRSSLRLTLQLALPACKQGQVGSPADKSSPHDPGKVIAGSGVPAKGREAPGGGTEPAGTPPSRAGGTCQQPPPRRVSPPRGPPRRPRGSPPLTPCPPPAGEASRTSRRACRPCPGSPGPPAPAAGP